MSKQITFDVEMKTTNLQVGDKIMMIDENDENEYIFIVLTVDFPKATIRYSKLHDERFYMDITETDGDFVIVD